MRPAADSAAGSAAPGARRTLPPPTPSQATLPDGVVPVGRELAGGGPDATGAPLDTADPLDPASALPPVTKKPMKPIGPAGLKALREAIRSGAYPSDDVVRDGIERLIRRGE